MFPDHILISVTEEDIAKGKRNSGDCPVAFALRRLFGERFEVTVSYLYCDKTKLELEVRTENLKLVYVCPDKICQKTLRFDKTGKMKPFDFKIVI